MSYHLKQSHLTSHFNKSLAVILTIALLAISIRADLYIRDDTADTGVEPNPSSGAMWLSPDIWVLRDPLPGWNPYPYAIGSPPAWMVPTPVHEDPDHRSPLSGKPNWVYVRIRNTSGSASTGTERLQLYWASASTGLNWDPAKVGGSFIDNVTGNVLFGAEITKVRKNAANASPAERAAYIAAIRKMATDPALVFSGGDSYWHTQQEIHRFGPSYRHGAGNPTFVPSVAFLPWHREYVNRYEGLLQEANPTVKLLYWQWNPASGTNHPETGTFNYFTNTFMGASGRTLSAGVPIGGPLFPDLNTLYPTDASVGLNGLPNVVIRRMQPTTTIQSDTTVINRSDYDSSTAANNFSGLLESLSHNPSHVFIAGYWGTPTPFELDKAGDQMFQPYAARDPFFFMLHGKVDELWARWQRKSLLNLDPATTYGTANGVGSNISLPMAPWNGSAFGDGLANDTTGEIEPWTLNGGQINPKAGDDRSVTSPPFYDTAPLTIPVMQPNQEVIMEIPWYPPSPASFGNISDPNHVCLIARIETSTSSPFGMTTPETADVNFNTNRNNNIAWRNVSVVDTFPGPLRIVRLFLRNTFRETALTGLRLGAKLDRPNEFFELGTVRVDLGRELFDRWRAAGGKGRGVEVEGRQLRLTQPDAFLEGIQLKGNETFPVRLTFELKRDYRPNKKGQRITYDVLQIGTPQDARAIVGGQRYEVDVAKIVPVQQGRTWRFLPGLEQPPPRWTSVEFDDSGWYQRRLDLGLVEPSRCGDVHNGGPTTYYFRHAFDVEDPGFMRSLMMRIKRSDGAIVYLNGKQVYSANLPERVTGRTRARAVTGVERNAFFPVKLDPSLLRKGRNVLAVEIHRAGTDNGTPTFDLELNANAESPQESPYVQFTNVAEGRLATAGKRALISVDALDTDGSVRSVAFIIDGEQVRTLEKGPFMLDWTFKPGPHRVTAVVTDNDGIQTKIHTTVTGVANVPPRVMVTQPSLHSELTAGDTLVIVAQADDSDGSIKKVEFFLNDSMIFGDPARLIGTADKAPFMLTVPNLKKRHNMITVVATDSGGARTAANPLMIIVRDKPGHTRHQPQ